MTRGDLVPFAGPGDYTSKPRPAVVVQSDRLRNSDSILLCLLTSEDDVAPGLRRVPVAPTPLNQLKRPSLVMVEKIVAAERSRCGDILGRLEPAVMDELNAALAFVLGLTD